MNTRQLMTPFLASFLAAGLLLLLPAAGSPCDRGEGAHRGRTHGPPPLAQLDLDQEQEEALRELRARTREQVRPLREALRERVGELRGTDGFQGPRSLRDDPELRSLRDRLRDLHEAARLEMESVLTPSQLERLEQLREAHRPGQHGERQRQRRRRHQDLEM